MSNDKSSSKTNKTNAVLNLLNRSAVEKNPILDDKFKEQNIIAEQIEQEAKKQPAARPAYTAGVEINVISELISELMPAVLKRFNCCTCDLCKAEMSVEALTRLTSVKVTIRTENDMKAAEELKSRHRRQVIDELIRIVLGRRKLPKHI